MSKGPKVRLHSSLTVVLIDFTLNQQWVCGISKSDNSLIDGGKKYSDKKEKRIILHLQLSISSFSNQTSLNLGPKREEEKNTINGSDPVVQHNWNEQQ